MTEKEIQKLIKESGKRVEEIDRRAQKTIERLKVLL